MVPLVAKVNDMVSQPTFAYEGWLTVTAAGACRTYYLDTQLDSCTTSE
jgi:hypothetical protein